MVCSEEVFCCVFVMEEVYEFGSVVVGLGCYVFGLLCEYFFVLFGDGFFVLMEGGIEW